MRAIATPTPTNSDDPTRALIAAVKSAWAELESYSVTDLTDDPQRGMLMRDQRPKGVLLINTDNRGMYGVQFGVLTDTELAHVSQVLGGYSTAHTDQVQLIATAAGKCPNCGTDLDAGQCPDCQR